VDTLLARVILFGTSLRPRIVKIIKKISFFPQEKATWRSCTRALSVFFVSFFHFKLSFWYKLRQSGCWKFQNHLSGRFSCFHFSFFYGYSRDGSHSIFFYVTLRQKRSNVKVAREINIPSAWKDYARPRVTYKSRRPRWNLGRNGKTVFISQDSLRLCENL